MLNTNATGISNNPSEKIFSVLRGQLRKPYETIQKHGRQSGSSHR